MTIHNKKQQKSSSVCMNDNKLPVNLGMFHPFLDPSYLIHEVVLDILIQIPKN